MLMKKQGVTKPWVQHRFVRKHRGLQSALLMAVPVSLAMWLAILHMLSVI